MPKKKTHYGKPFAEYKKPVKAKPKPKSKKSSKPDLTKQTVVKKTKKKPVLSKPVGVAKLLRDRQRKQADRIAKMFK